MELLYCWLTGTNPNTIDTPQGFNLGPMYDFSVDYDGDQYYLVENNNWNHHPSVFQKDNIRNLSVIVGENGSGKTTLLKWIFANAEELDDNDGIGIYKNDITPFPIESSSFNGEPIKCILVFFDGDCKIHVYTSLTNLNYSRIERLTPIMHSIGGRTKLDLYDSGEFPFQDTTIIYMTNSTMSHHFMNISYCDGVHALPLTMDTVQNISKKYYDSLCESVEANPYKRIRSPYLTWAWVLSKQNEEIEFQNLLYIAYYHRLLNDGRYFADRVKSPVIFSLHICNIPRLLMNYIRTADIDGFQISNVMAIIMVTVLEAEKSWEGFLEKEDLMTRVLYLNLIIETVWRTVDIKDVDNFTGNINALEYSLYSLSGGLYYVKKTATGGLFIQENDGNLELANYPEDYIYNFWPFSDGVSDVNTVIKWIKTRVNAVSRDGRDTDTECIKSALYEVKEFLGVLESERKQRNPDWEELIEWHREFYSSIKDRTKSTENNHDHDLVGDSFFNVLSTTNFNLVYQYDEKPIDVGRIQNNNENDNNKRYISMIALINKYMEKKHSFVLKYLRIRTLGMSSGERGLLNHLAWISEIPFLIERLDRKHHYKGRTKPGVCIENECLKKDLLLLIDEPDLYMHPQWQKNLVKELLEGIRHRYNDKHVQMIMTTSSPLTLSDIPVENTVYIRYDRNTNERHFEEHRQNQIDQTFGADIYKLFLNSFFLKGGPIGEYAEEFINNDILMPLNEMRIRLWENEVAIANNKTRIIDEKEKLEIRKRLESMDWKINMIANTSLFKKSFEMYSYIKEWCDNNDSNSL